MKIKYGPLAHLVERLFCKEEVRSSSLLGSTKLNKFQLLEIFEFFCSHKVLSDFNKFRGSSAVERSPVKRLVVGSIPTLGAKMSDNKENSQVDFFALISSVLILLGVYVLSNYGINTEQFITILKILIWPSIVILAFRNNIISTIVNRLSGVELPGGIKGTFHSRQEASDPKDISEEVQKNSITVDTSFLDGFLVQNSKETLAWFNQHGPISLDIFLEDSRKLSQGTNRQEIDEKWIIFGALLSLGLIEFQKGTVKVTEEGKKYLEHLKIT